MVALSKKQRPVPEAPKPSPPVLLDAAQLIGFVNEKFGDEIAEEIAGAPMALLCLRIQKALVTAFSNVGKGPEPTSIKVKIGDGTQVITFCQSLIRGYLYKRLCWSLA